MRIFAAKNQKIVAILFLLIIIIFTTALLYARAGGAGGFGDSGDSDIFFIVNIILSLPFPYNIIVLIILIILALYTRKKSRQRSILNKVPASVEVYDNALNKLKEIVPDFNENEFIKKIETSFYQVQEAWSKQSIKPIRKFISDGMYQRFNAQFIMMKEIEQENILSNIQLHNIKIINVKRDGQYVVTDVAVEASLYDKFISKKIKDITLLDSLERFIEIWTFIRKINITKNGDLYNNINCPQCGAAINELEGEISICPYCKTILNTGEFDWILCEITQIDDYPTAERLSKRQKNIKNEINELYSKDSQFSIQLLEDKASNAFIQVFIAKALNDIVRIRRFSDDSFFNSIQTNEKIIYYRFYLNYVTLIGAWNKDNDNYLSFYIKATFRRLRPKDNESFEWIDNTSITHSYVLILKRSKDYILPIGKVYAHQCPNCGGSIEDTIDTKCPYCGSQVNSSKHEWIVHNIMTPKEYESFAISSEILKKPSKTMYDGMKIRDYVFNNVCVVLAADGQIDEMELNYLNKLASKLGYSQTKIKGMLNLAQNGKLKLKYPNSEKERLKVFEYMKKAAEANSIITQEEKQILKEFEKIIHS
jgi:uncharacterized Zn finger protein (UPF0148 family)